MPTYKRKEGDFYTNRVGKWGGRFILDGYRSPTKDSIVLTSNDYLALANHPDILKAQAETLLQHGNGLMMSAVFLRGQNPHSLLEEHFARYLRADSTVLCQSGWCANVGLLQCITDETTPVYIDAMAHMSLWEGAKSAGASAKVFRHNDISHLERQVKKYGAGVIIVDSIYSTDGSVCPLNDLVQVGSHSGCVIVVDESHSLGTKGPRGAGLVIELGLQDKVHFRTASLSKAFCGRAGIITCHSRFHLYFKSSSFPAIFSSALFPHEIAALNKSLAIIQASEDRRAALRHNAAYLRKGLDALGYNVGSDLTHIIALEAGSEHSTMKLRDLLEERDVFGAVFCAPATAHNRSLVRFSLNANLTSAQLQHILNACSDIREAVELQNWPSSRRKTRRLTISGNSPTSRADRPSLGGAHLTPITQTL